MRTAYSIRQRLGFPLQPADVLHASSMQQLLDHVRELARQTVYESNNLSEETHGSLTFSAVFENDPLKHPIFEHLNDYRTLL
jgi:hypothetical protein